MSVAVLALLLAVSAENVYTNAMPRTGVTGRTKVVFTEPDTTPIVFGFETKTRDYVAAGGRCDLWFDAEYDDGSHFKREWGFGPTQGTHDWERSTDCFYPGKRKVRSFSIRFYARDPKGTIKTRNWFIRRERPSPFISSATVCSDVPRSHRRFLRVEFPRFLVSDWSARISDGSVFYGTCADSRDAGGRTVFLPIPEEKGHVCFSLKGKTSRVSTTAQTVGFPAATACGNPVTAREARVWACDSSRRVYGCDFPEGTDTASATLDLARRGRGAIQVVISTGEDRSCSQVSVHLSPLRDGNNRVFQGRVNWNRIGYLPRIAHHYSTPGYPQEGETMWTPDVLLPSSPFAVTGGVTRAVWVSYDVAESCPPGVYRGKVGVLDAGRVIGTVDVAVRVRDFSLPETFGMSTSFTLLGYETKNRYRNDCERMHGRLEDLVLDYRLVADNLDRRIPPSVDCVRHWIEKGAPSFCMLSLKELKAGDPLSEFEPGWRPDIVETGRAHGDAIASGCYEGFRDRIRPAYDAYCNAGLIDKAFIYGFDEKGHADFGAVEKFSRLLKGDFPRLAFMTTTKLMEWRRNHPEGTNEWLFTDWHCPAVHRWSRQARDEVKASGKKAWWYVFAAPQLPMANFASVENPPVDGIVLGWETWAEQSDGLLYWLANGWGSGPLLDEDEEFFEDFRLSGNCPGDGVLTYPGKSGPLASIRLAKTGEGVQFHEWLSACERKVGRQKTMETLSRIHTDLTHFSRDAAEIAAVRSAIGDLVESGDGK